MNLSQFIKTINQVNSHPKYFLSVNFGCRVNSAEINQLSQILVDHQFLPTKNNPPHLILVNTCSITQKGEKESLSKIRHLRHRFPNAIILATGCANLSKISSLDSVYIFDNSSKESILLANHCQYTSKISDKFSQSKKFILKIQSGCTQFCSYCTVPYRRQYLFSLPPQKAVDAVNNAHRQGYREIIITGVNLDQYSFGLSKLISQLLLKTQIPKISFGSLPINTIDNQFIKLFSENSNKSRLPNFLHIPIQSGSDKILKLMKRPYTTKKINQVFQKLTKHQPDLKFGTDIIVGFPGETDDDFQKTLNLCKNIGFTKIHTFRFSPRPNTLAEYYLDKFPKIDQNIIRSRSQKIRQIKQ